MGYRVNTELSFYDDNQNTIENIDRINEYINRMDRNEELPSDEITSLDQARYSRCWYGETNGFDVENMLPLTKEFPEIKFKLEVEGEEMGDNSIYYLYKGEYEETDGRPNFDRLWIHSVSMDDWDGIYIGNDLIQQGHSVNVCDLMEHLIEHKIDMGDYKYKGIYVPSDSTQNQTDEELSEFGGSFPESFEKLNDYYKFK